MEKIIYFGASLPKDEVLEIAIRKMAIECNGVSEEVKEHARQWLTERGMRAGL